MGSEYLNNKELEKNIIQFQAAKREKSKQSLIIGDLDETVSRKKVKNCESKEEAKRLRKHKVLYQTACYDQQESEKALAANFYTLSENIVRWAKFQLLEPEDGVQEGVMICFEKIARFDPRKGAAFNYLTTCIYNHLKQMYRTNRNFNELKKKYHEFLSVQNQTVMRNGKEVVAVRASAGGSRLI
jgi:DNA-directed RNA polymerase specialized sigma subunit